MTTDRMPPRGSSSHGGPYSQAVRPLAKTWARSGPNVTILSLGYIRSELVGDWFDTNGSRRQMARWPSSRLLEEDSLDTMLIYLLFTGSDVTIDDGPSL